MNPLTKTIVFLVLTFAFVVLYGHGSIRLCIGSDVGWQRTIVSTSTKVVGGAVDAFNNYFYPPPPPPPVENTRLKSMLEKAPSAIEADVNLRPSTYVPPKQPKQTPHQQPVSIDPHQ